jgi:transcriptional regulator with XRE-family HTH domain
MPPRGQPTARQARLGAELRKLREQAGMSGAEAAASLGWERPQISHIESGRWGVSGERVRHLAAHYSVQDTAYVDALAAMADDRTKGWWTEYRGILTATALDLAELEHHAARLRTVEMLIVPGILQTREYAQAVFGGAVTRRSPDEIEAAVAHRLGRRSIFERPSPPEFRAYIHESALRIHYADREVMRAQLDFLCEAAAWPTVSIRVIPFAAEGVTSSIRSLVYAGGPVPQLDTVQVSGAFDGVLLDAEAQLRKYRNLLDAVEAIALGAAESKNSICAISKEL